MTQDADERQPVPYGYGTSENGGCDECWQVPGRHCCLWNEVDHGADSPSSKADQ